MTLRAQALTLWRLLDGDVALKTHCNKKARKPGLKELPLGQSLTFVLSLRDDLGEKQ